MLRGWVDPCAGTWAGTGRFDPDRGRAWRLLSGMVALETTQVAGSDATNAEQLCLTTWEAELSEERRGWALSAAIT
jgi:hypothetical protein